MTGRRRPHRQCDLLGLLREVQGGDRTVAHGFLIRMGKIIKDKYPELDEARDEELVPERNASYPTFPPPLRVSYSIQIPKTIRHKLKKCRAFSSPPLPSARAVYVRTRPQRGLAGVFSISGSHLVRLVPQFESGQNCSDGLHRLGAAVKRGS